MKLIFVLALVFIEIFLVNLPEIVQVVRAFGINAFVYDEMLTIFLGNKSMSAVRASELEGCMTILFWREKCLANLALKLTFGTIVLVEIDLRCIASGAFAIVRDIAFRTTPYRLDGLIIRITPLKISHEIPVIPWLNIQDQRELINLKFLIFGRMRILISPLFKRNISTDKVDQPAVLLIELVDDFK